MTVLRYQVVRFCTNGYELVVSAQENLFMLHVYIIHREWLF